LCVKVCSVLDANTRAAPDNNVTVDTLLFRMSILLHGRLIFVTDSDTARHSIIVVSPADEVGIFGVINDVVAHIAINRPNHRNMNVIHCVNGVVFHNGS